MGKHDRSGPGRSSIIGSDLKPSDKATLQLRRLCHHPPPHNSDRATFAQSHREHGQAPCVRDPGRLPAHEGARPTAEARNGRAKPPATGMPGQQARHQRHAGVPRAPGGPAAAPPPRGSRWRHRLPAVSFIPGEKPGLSSPETASTTGFFEPRPRDRCRLPHFNLKLQFCPPRTAPVTRVNGANEPAREHRRSRLRPFVCRSRHVPKRTGSEATQHHAAIRRPARRSHEKVPIPPPRTLRFVRPAAACRPPRPLRLPAGRPSSRPATGGEPARTAGR